MEYDEIVDIFLGGGGVITKMDYFWGSFIYILGHFLNVKVQNWNIFSRLLNLKYCGIPDIPDIFGVNSGC